MKENFQVVEHLDSLLLKYEKLKEKGIEEVAGDIGGGARVSLVAQAVKRLSAVQENQVQSLGWEDALENEMAAYSSTLA